MPKVLSPEGQIFINGERHQVEYEPSGMTGLGAVYLRVIGVDHVVPISAGKIDEVCELLQRAKAVIQAAEGDSSHD